MNRTLRRGAGLLLHISSLPSPYGIGTLGKAAYDFIDLLKQGGQSYWQVLPLGPTSYGDSPYQSFSAFAGNPYFIDLDLLKQDGLLTQSEIDSFEWSRSDNTVSYDLLFKNRLPLLKTACNRSGCFHSQEFQEFYQQHQHWLADYSLYMACKQHFGHREWLVWEDDIKFRKPEALTYYQSLLKEELLFYQFLQFLFYQQWHRLTEYAHRHGISLIGDIPIYVALDSADVWTNPHLFLLDETTLMPTNVAGVPPDAFSETGQLWGNPLYRWDVMAAEGFAWWKARMKCSSLLYDFIRIDHFIGLVRYYSIPFGAADGTVGEWHQGPGRSLLDAVEPILPDTGIIAEDLGVFLPEVKQLLKEKGYPGMKVLEFAFSQEKENEHLPYHYSAATVVYGGTHDNETLQGFLTNPDRSVKELEQIRQFMQIPDSEQPLRYFFYTAYASVAAVAIFQIQDVLGLGNQARMNTPATIGNNWNWRLVPGQLTSDQINWLKSLVDLYGR